MVHYESALVHRANRLAEDTNMVRMANHAGKRTYSKYINDLRNTRENVERALGKKRGTAEVFRGLNKLIGTGKRRTADGNDRRTASQNRG